MKPRTELYFAIRSVIRFIVKSAIFISVIFLIHAAANSFITSALLSAGLFAVYFTVLRRQAS